jgi:hypothetical protein
MRAMQERRDSGAAASESLQTRRQRWALMLRPGRGATGAAVGRLRERQQGRTLVLAAISAEGSHPVGLNSETDAIVGRSDRHVIPRG